MVNVIGLGYIGLPTALMMASHGVEVVGTDRNAALVETLNAGKTTFKEEGLDELFEEGREGGRGVHHRSTRSATPTSCPCQRPTTSSTRRLTRRTLSRRPGPCWRWLPKAPFSSSSPRSLRTRLTVTCARCWPKPAARTSRSSMPPSASSRATW